MDHPPGPTWSAVHIMNYHTTNARVFLVSLVLPSRYHCFAMPYTGCRKKKVTGRYQLQFPLKWVHSQLRGRTAEEWREIILAAWDASSPALKQQWRHSFHSTIDDLMKTTLTVKNRTGRRFDRDAYAREAHFVYGPAVSPSDAPPKLLARCFKHSVDFVVHHGLSISGLAESFTNTGEHTVPSDTAPQDVLSASSAGGGNTECDSCDDEVYTHPPKMAFCFGGDPVPAPDMADVDMCEDDDKPLLDEMLNWSEEDIFACDDDLQLSVDPEHVPDLYLSNEFSPSSPRQPLSSSDEAVWRSIGASEECAHQQVWDGDGFGGASLEQQLLWAREDLTAARRQRDDAVHMCQQLQAQLTQAQRQREQSPGTDVPEDGCFR